MIEFKNIETSEPYTLFKKYCDSAINKNQMFYDAIAISSLNKKLNEVSSRYVNLKFIHNNEWIFFTNYNSRKALDFAEHNQIAGLIFWDSINVQIRIKALIEKTPTTFSREYFKNRKREKNALAIASKQSMKIKSHKAVIKKFENALMSEDLSVCPSYWGGYSFKPFYFEFWEGHKNRLNKRIAFNLVDMEWKKYFLEP